MWRPTFGEESDKALLDVRMRVREELSAKRPPGAIVGVRG
jgi:hypothetical protein